jgi:hypothetical protein
MSNLPDKCFIGIRLEKVDWFNIRVRYMTHPASHQDSARGGGSWRDIMVTVSDTPNLVVISDSRDFNGIGEKSREGGEEHRHLLKFAPHFLACFVYIP